MNNLPRVIKVKWLGGKTVVSQLLVQWPINTPPRHATDDCVNIKSNHNHRSIYLFMQSIWPRYDLYLWPLRSEVKGREAFQQIQTQRPWSFCKTCVAMKFVDDDDDDDMINVCEKNSPKIPPLNKKILRHAKWPALSWRLSLSQKIAFNLARKPWPLTSDLENLCSNAHLKDERCAQFHWNLSTKYEDIAWCKIGTNRQTADHEM